MLFALNFPLSKVKVLILFFVLTLKACECENIEIIRLTLTELKCGKISYFQ